MKNKVLGLIALTSLFVLNGMSQTFLVDTLNLNSAFRELVSNPDTKEYQEKYFNAFPDTWQEFYSLYRYVGGGNYDLAMYHLASEQIGALDGMVTQINDTVYCRKLVNIAIGAVYEADAPNYYKALLHRVMWKKTDVMLYTVSLLRKGYQMQFWQFYWSSASTSKDMEEEYHRLFQLNACVCPRQTEIMRIAFEYFYDGVNIDGGYLEAD